MGMFEAIRDLRSFRSCRDEPVSRSSLGKILEAGKHAPSPGNRQCMEFIVVESEDGRSKLADATGDHRVEQSPVAVIVLEDLERMRGLVGDAMCEEACVAEASVCAQNMRLVAREEGLSSCWITGFDSEMVRHQFRIPDAKMVAGVLITAYTDDEIEPGDRFNLNEIAFYEEYENQFQSQFDGLQWKGVRNTTPATGRQGDTLLRRIKRKLGII